MQDINHIIEYLDKWGISKKIISQKMEMNENTFRVKLSPSYPAVYFRPSELHKLKNVIFELLKDTHDLVKQEFDQAKVA